MSYSSDPDQSTWQAGDSHACLPTPSSPYETQSSTDPTARGRQKSPIRPYGFNQEPVDSVSEEGCKPHLLADSGPEIGIRDLAH